jgi:rod shape-determining protein MreC
MNKDHVTVFLITLALLAGAIRYTNPLHDYFLEGLNGIKNTYWSIVESVEDTIEEHFNQQDTIIALREANKAYKNDRILLQSIAAELNAVMASNKRRVDSNRTHVQLARAISYAKFGDRNKVWLEMDDFNRSKMYGLIRNGESAGIVIEKLGKAQALLNGDHKCSYAVYIGAKKAPGIARGKNSDEMLVEFIPTWMKIKVGDEVKTSGLDQLFYEGIPVGRVKSFNQSQGFQTAVIEPYADTLNLGYFHVLDQSFHPVMKTAIK